MSNQRSTFGSRFGAIAAIAGSAVGLGNIWKFPYVAGENGGAAFLLIYIGITLLISIPVLLSEFVIGRRGQSNAFRSFLHVAPHKAWGAFGILELLGAVFILSFYCVIAGWSLEYVYQSAAGGFEGMTQAQMDTRFNDFVASGYRPIFWMAVFLLLNAVVLGMGVTKGIERCSKFMIPALFCILVMLAGVNLWQPGFKEGAAFILKPDWSEVTGQTIIKALGQSFFSLSIGMAAMVTYGSYIKRQESLVSVSVIVSLATVVMAVLAGLAIFPSVFTYHVPVASGPDLVFKTLPPLFAQLPGGYIISIMFFVLLFFAALTTSLSIMESLVAFFSDELHIKRISALGIGFAIIIICSTLCALSQMPDSHLHIGSLNLFDWTDTFSSNYILPIAGLGCVVLVGWFVPKSTVEHELTSSGRYPLWIFRCVLFMMRFVCPPIILFMFINGLL
ncbi:MAG: sodium-dependent transporter [Paludibacteraceae bacterium]|nr:sodium-dependent transporter [Paludibacteraceae bacterium]